MKMKKAHNAGIKLMIAGFAIGLIETIIFLIIQGWHYKATSEIEIAFDLIAAIVIKIGFFFWLLSAVWLVNKIYKQDMVE
jgi:hypothetical protein